MGSTFTFQTFFDPSADFFLEEVSSALRGVWVQPYSRGCTGYGTHRRAPTVTPRCTKGLNATTSPQAQVTPGVRKRPGGPGRENYWVRPPHHRGPPAAEVVQAKAEKMIVSRSTLNVPTQAEIRRRIEVEEMPTCLPGAFLGARGRATPPALNSSQRETLRRLVSQAMKNATDEEKLMQPSRAILDLFRVTAGSPAEVNDTSNSPLSFFGKTKPDFCVVAHPGGPPSLANLLVPVELKSELCWGDALPDAIGYGARLLDAHRLRQSIFVIALGPNRLQLALLERHEQEITFTRTAPLALLVPRGHGTANGELNEEGLFLRTAPTGRFALFSCGYQCLLS
ncbi:hypothetical protein PAPYR_7755 [Paratrimastix pyriformis]|uniref:Uncharacterized protein n=1 Tax=Paratrimastix pyriformis TaxID=342808 RepID=A0ABQ8UGC6_9EUKA|nr:hypothetical protein PAPYR_7755 [Paratrimastix pyriformis]